MDVSPITVRETRWLLNIPGTNMASRLICGRAHGVELYTLQHTFTRSSRWEVASDNAHAFADSRFLPQAVIDRQVSQNAENGKLEWSRSWYEEFPYAM